MSFLKITFLALSFLFSGVSMAGSWQCGQASDSKCYHGAATSGQFAAFENLVDAGEATWTTNRASALLRAYCGASTTAGNDLTCTNNDNPCGGPANCEAVWKTYCFDKNAVTPTCTL